MCFSLTLEVVITLQKKGQGLLETKSVIAIASYYVPDYFMTIFLKPTTLPDIKLENSGAMHA